MSSPWILIRQVTNGADQEWAVGHLDLRTRTMTNISWYYTEDEARVAHHRLVYGHGG